MRLFINALWSPAGKGLTSWLWCVMSNCDVVTFPFCILGQVWCLIVSIPDLCPLSDFLYGSSSSERINKLGKAHNIKDKSNWPIHFREDL